MRIRFERGGQCCECECSLQSLACSLIGMVPMQAMDVLLLQQGTHTRLDTPRILFDRRSGNQLAPR